MAIHVANLKLANVDRSGTVFSKAEPGATIARVMTSDIQMRLIPDPTIPNTAGSPTLKTYLEAEDAAGFKLVHLDQYLVITET